LGGFEGVRFWLQKGEIGGAEWKRRKSGLTGRQERSGLRVQDGAEDRDDEMGEMFGALVELKPANHAVVAEIFGDARFRNAEMISKERLDGDAGAAIAAAARHVGDGDAKRVAGFDVIVGCHIVVGENEDARASRSVSGLIEFYGGAGEEPAELHLEKRDARRESRVAEAAFYAGAGDFGGGFDGETGN